MKNTIMTIKNCTDVESKAIALYFYRLVEDVDDFCSHEECQALYNALVKKLGLEKHAKKIMKACIEKLIKQKKLTPRSSNSKFNPYDSKKKPERFFNEDQDLYESCGQFSTETLEDIDLVRCVFSGEQGYFQKIIGWTFFAKPAPEGKAFSVTREAKPSVEYLKAALNTDDVDFLRESLRLSDEETRLLACTYRTNAVVEFYNVVNDLNRDEIDRIGSYASEMDLPKKEVRKLLSNEGKLCNFGLIRRNGEFEYDAINCIESQDLNVYFADIITKEKSEKTFSLDSFSVKPEKTALVERLLGNDSAGNILFYGAAGAGKTEYAKSLVKASGLEPLIYKNELEVKNGDNDEERHETALYRLNCLLSVKQEGSVIIVDEAESVLKTIGSFFGMKYSLPQKGTVNKMLENTENKVIWIMNYTNELDESTLRRFTYSLRFADMPKEMLRTIAENKLKDVSMPENLKTGIVDLFGQYHVTGSSVDNMVKTVKGMNCTAENSEAILKDVKDVLEANSTLIFGKAKMRELVNDSYDLSVLNTSIPAEEMVEMLETASQYEDRERSSQSGIRMLFYGLSGTGKTELVRYIAGKLNKKIVLKRASDIMGKYVGENEKNIRAAFEEAEANDAILLFDEADSFFADRSDVTNSWERTMVNEFLTQMEEFSGILICTTNLRKIMDPAMERRFHIMAEFKPLNREGIETLLGKFFGDYHFEETEIEKISAYGTVTPGDFGSLSGKIRFVPRSRVNAAYIVDGLCGLQKEKQAGKTIGFGA